MTVVSNYEKIGKHAERITKIKPFINKYNSDGITIHQKKMVGKKVEKKNAKISLNVLYL